MHILSFKGAEVSLYLGSPAPSARVCPDLWSQSVQKLTASIKNYSLEFCRKTRLSCAHASLSERSVERCSPIAELSDAVSGAPRGSEAWRAALTRSRVRRKPASDIARSLENSPDASIASTIISRLLASSGMTSIGTARPCLDEFLEERALPSAVLGPVECRALSLLILALRESSPLDNDCVHFPGEAPAPIPAVIDIVDEAITVPHRARDHTIKIMDYSHICGK